MLKELTGRRKKNYDITVFQTPQFRQDRGYTQVYRLAIKAEGHQDCFEKVFKLFNVPDTIPADYKGRFMSTGDIILIDEGLRGHHYYQLKAGGWTKINRIQVR
ncbi:hypothetical protein CU633_05175 [Bacillus sp. V3-13]|uniref:YodL domain-containing protein n=1 Tax=Bacillus sp. V3-13 TaxID=2053728 RepID=UPI000C77C42F|nr:YodL domain-containing protein [Bacillus sp. V3-13]PLR78377.1 hypothetical protein CU633_05175 [Bacillus sp. V3-13]